MSFYDVGPVSFDSVSAVTATPGSKDGEVGYRKWEGGLEYVKVYNAGGSDIAPGQGAVLAAGSSDYSVTVSSVAGSGLVVGVCRHATLTTATYGYLVVKGITPVEMGASSSGVAGAALELGANGIFTGFQTGPVAGSLMSAVASGASAGAYVSCY